MSNYTKIALVTLFVTNFTLFLGWVPIGVLIPQTIFIVVTLLMQPKALVSRPMLLLYIYFLYQIISELFYGKGFDFISKGAQLLGMGVPLIISSVIFTPKFMKDCRGISKYAIIVSFVTILLSIRILINDGNALRVTSMANSTDDLTTLYYYWRQGIADYSMAAMMLFMPVVLIYYYKTVAKRSEYLLLFAGIITVVVFMYLGQVTTTLLMCLMVTVLSVINNKNKSFYYIMIGMIIILFISIFTNLMDFAIAHTGETAMNDRLTSIAGAVSGEELDEFSDAGIRWMLTVKTVRAFLANPLFGNSAIEIGGHNYFIDCLARYGLIGCLPFFLLIKNQVGIIQSYLSNGARRYFYIIILGFLLLGILKKLSGTEYWNYLYVYYPAILVWIDSKTKKTENKIIL